MPIGPDGQSYDAAEALPRFDIPYRVLTATGESGAIEVGDVEELRAVFGVHEHYATALAGTNNDIVWIARTAGASALTITYVVSGNSTPLSVVKATNDITVNVATDSGGTATSTANDIIDYVLGDEAASLVEQAVVPVLADGNDGTGVVTALSQQSLGNPTGTAPTLDLKLQASIDGGSTYADVAAFSQKTVAAADRKIFVGLGDYAKWVWTIGGTSPVFAVSLVATGKGE
jgi:hypothetical protein